MRRKKKERNQILPKLNFEVSREENNKGFLLKITDFLFPDTSFSILVSFKLIQPAIYSASCVANVLDSIIGKRSAGT